MSNKKLSKKSKIILSVVIAVLVICIFNPVSLFRIKKWTLYRCKDVYVAAYKDELDDDGLVGGIPKNEMVGKNVNDVDERYNVVLEHYDSKGTLIGRIYDTTFKYYMVHGFGSKVPYNFVYAEIKDGTEITQLRLFDSTLSDRNLRAYYGDYYWSMTKNEYAMHFYWNELNYYDDIAPNSKWTKFEVVIRNYDC